jgi:class III poly(R)-hydroxyalkanoic acid synthase PhaE subunit
VNGCIKTNIVAPHKYLLHCTKCSGSLIVNYNSRAKIMAKNIFWNDDWMDIQRRYWEQLTDMQQQAFGAKKPPANPWQQSMDHWWSAVQGGVPPAGQDFFNKMMDQGKAFFQMAEQAMQAAGQENPSEVWSHMLSSLTESLHQNTESSPFKQATAFWEMPLDNWNRMASAMSPLPGDTLRGMPHEGIKENLDRLLTAPGLGYTRESQTQYQSLAQAVLEYQEALAEYSLFFASLGEKTVRRLQDQLGDAPVESARQLYDEWIGCCEEVYAAEVMTDDYAKMHGRLVNALMELKHRWGEILNESLSAMNIPTHDDLRTLQIRMQEQRRENKSLRSDISALRREIRQMQAKADRPAVKRTVKKKTATKKKSTTKKKTAARKAAPRKKKSTAGKRQTN